jgi:hypothetical protein
MTRLGIVFWSVLVLAAGFTTFMVKYAVQDIEEQLNRVRRHIVAEQQEIRVLNTEWTYLNQPERLAELNRRFLGLAPIAARQLQRTIADIPLRTPAAPPAEPPDEQVLGVPEAVAEATPDPAAPPIRPGALTVTQAALGPTPAPLGPAAPAPAVPAPAALSPAAAKRAARVELAAAGPAAAPGSLDALFAQIADAR